MVNKVKLAEIKELVDLIDKEQNKDIDISSLYTNSSIVLNWKCPKGHSFKEKVNVMFRRKNKCFFCTGRQIWPGENDLQTLFPDIAREFDVEKNGITPDRVSPKDTNTYYWTCANKHPSYPRSVEHRVNRDAGCPYCSGRLAIRGENDLKTLYPEIAEEWDYEKNKGVLPSEIKPFTNKKYYWICLKCGKSYPAYPGNRIKGSGCPDCAHKEIGKKNSKKVGQYDKDGTLINTYDGLHEAARIMGVVPNAIFQAVKNGKTSKGFYWKYI